MPRYIDADYFDKLITQLIYEGRNITRNEYKMIDNILCEFPTVDVVDKDRYDRLLEDSVIISEALNKYQTADMVEVVRCKYCKHSFKRQLGYGCEMNYRLATNGLFFCADGERRKDDE